LVAGPFFRQVTFGIDSGDRANRNARPTVDALYGIDIEHWKSFKVALIPLGMDAVHGTCVNTSSVFYTNARFRDDECDDSL
jgi:hypothetical protein